MSIYEQPHSAEFTMSAIERDLFEAINRDGQADHDRWLDDMFDDYEDFGMYDRPDSEPDSDVPADLFFMGERPDNGMFYDLEATADYKEWELEQERLYEAELEKREADALALEEFAAKVEAKFARRDASKHRLGQFGTHRVMVHETDEDKDIDQAKQVSAAARKPFAKK